MSNEPAIPLFRLPSIAQRNIIFLTDYTTRYDLRLCSKRTQLLVDSCPSRYMKLEIRVHLNKIRILIFHSSYDSHYCVPIVYRAIDSDDGNMCSRIRRLAHRFSRVPVYENFMTAACKEIKSILQSPRFTVENLCVSDMIDVSPEHGALRNAVMQSFVNNMKEILESRQKIFVKHFSTNTHETMVGLLQFLNKNSIQSISCPKRLWTADLETILESEQWKNIVSLQLPTTALPMKYFRDFKAVRISVNRMSRKDADDLIKSLPFDTLVQWELAWNVTIQQLERGFGVRGERNAENRYQTIFEVNDTHTVFYEQNLLTLSKIEAPSVLS
ncbi:unnamed protein product [Caenorhabditis sp. 36 PRJEB53466]|nr:unnamed protein product [Caenorhabditis sp. 36 PRJEB53466]